MNNTSNKLTIQTLTTSITQEVNQLSQTINSDIVILLLQGFQNELRKLSTQRAVTDEEALKKEFGDILRKYPEPLSQSELADKLSCSKSTISYYESGKILCPTPQFIKLVEVFGHAFLFEVAIKTAPYIAQIDQ